MSSKASVIPDSWEDADPPSFNANSVAPLIPQDKGKDKGKGKAKQAEEVKAKKQRQPKSAFSDDEEDQPRSLPRGPPVSSANFDEAERGIRDDHDDDDGDNYSDDDEPFSYEDEDPDFMVPVKKKEFERMFNVKVVSPEEAIRSPTQNPGDQTNPSASQDDYVAPNEPLLLVNWTRLTGGVITSDPTGAVGGLTAEQREARDHVLDSILENFETRCEEIFKEGLAYHSDTSVWDRDLQKIAKNFPNDCWGPLGYPKVTGNYNIKDSWAAISKPSKWNSVTAMKKCIGSCSRGIVWKLLLVEEIERLGNEQGKLLEAGLVKLPDPKTRTPEEERKAAEQVHPSNFTAKDLNVLDKIIAMAFERTPVLGNEDTHFQTLAKKHFILKKLWFDEFGSLPKV